VHGEDIVHGGNIMYDASAEYAEVLSGGSKTATGTTPPGRVKAVIQPKKKTPAAEGAAPAGK